MGSHRRDLHTPHMLHEKNMHSFFGPIPVLLGAVTCCDPRLGRASPEINTNGLMVKLLRGTSASQVDRSQRTSHECQLQ